MITPPFGYFKDKNTKQVVIVEECADIIRRIFHLYLEGDGYTHIAKHLNDNGFNTRVCFETIKLAKQEHRLRE